jgi:hypothetical protein
MGTFEDDDTDLPDDVRICFRQELCRLMIADGTKTLTGRAMAILLINQMMKVTPASSLSIEIQEIVLDPAHKGRLKDGSGPTLGFDLGNKERGRIPLETILWQPTKELRASALREIESRAAANSAMHPLLAPTTLLKLQGLANQLMSDQIEIAMDAAYRGIVLLDNDFFFSVSEVRQGLLLNDDDSLISSIKRALHPSPEAVSFMIEHPARELRSNPSKIEDLAAGICTSSVDLSSLLDKYFRSFGHLPLSGKWSLGQVLRCFIKELKLNQPPWDEAWDWASKHESPLATYHVCQAFLNNPSWVNDERRPVLLLRAAEFIDLMLKGKRGLRRSMLMRHYRQYLETLEFSTDGEIVATTALWFSEYVTCLLESCGSRLADKAFAQIEISIRPATETWTICMPPTTPSLLRAGTQLCDSVWVTSLLGELAISELMLNFEDDTVFATSIEPVLSQILSVELPDKELNGALSLGNSQAILRSRYGGNNRKIRDYNRQGDFGAQLRGFLFLTQIQQEVLARDLLCLAIQGQVPGSLIYELLSDTTWRAAALASPSESIAMQIFDALRELGLKQNDKDWPRLIPHFCALACEDEIANPGMRLDVLNRLFDFLVRSCVTFNSSSAIDRVLTTNRKPLRTRADFWIGILEKIGADTPQWAVAKCRGVLVALDG